MISKSTSFASALSGVIVLGAGSMTAPVPVAIDLENRYPSVGAIMVWRVDEAGQAAELRGFASGTLIGERAMVTAGHFTRPGYGTRLAAAVDPDVRELQPHRRKGPHHVDSRGAAGDAPLDAALSAAASM